MSNIPWYLNALKQGIEAAENMNIHPDLKQAAIDQGIRPAGYYDPNTGWSCLSTDKLVDLHKGIYDRAVKDAVDRMLEILDRHAKDTHPLDYNQNALLAIIRKDVQALTEDKL